MEFGKHDTMTAHICVTIAFMLLLLRATSAQTQTTNSSPNVYYFEESCGKNFETVIVNSPVKVRLRRPDMPTSSASSASADLAPGAGAGPTCSAYADFRTTRPRHLLLTSIRRFHLSDRSPTGDCLKQFLQVNEQSSKRRFRLCHELESLKPGEDTWLTNDTLQFYYFRSLPLSPEHDIELTVAPVARADLHTGCSEVYDLSEEPAPFHCVEDGLCLGTSLRCDGTNNCRDGSDEEGCPTTSVSSPEPDVNQSKPLSTEATRDVLVSITRGESTATSSNALQIVLGVCGGVILFAILAALIAIVVFRVSQRGSFQTVATEEPSNERRSTRDTVQNETQQQRIDTSLAVDRTNTPRDSEV